MGLEQTAAPESEGIQRGTPMRGLSFSQRLQAGWSKEQLIKFYSLTDDQYERILASLDRIHQAEPGGFVYHQCYGKRLLVHSCQVCSQQAACNAEA